MHTFYFDVKVNLYSVKKALLVGKIQNNYGNITILMFDLSNYLKTSPEFCGCFGQYRIGNNKFFNKSKCFFSLANIPFIYTQTPID